MIESIPKFGDELATAATAGKNSVDGGEDQRQEAAGDEEDDLEIQEASYARAKGFQRNFQNFACEYI